MARYLFLLVILSTTKLYANTSTVWYDGAVVLIDQQVLTGQVAIHSKQNIILLRSGEKLTVYPAHKVQNVFYYDQKHNINRKFVSIANRERGFAEYQLFEIVLRGEVVVLRKQRMYSDSNDHDDFTYFIVYCDEVLPIRKFSKNVYPHLSNCDSQVFSKFVEQEHLNPNSPMDAICLIKYYNQLVRDSNSLAMR